MPDFDDFRDYRRRDQDHFTRNMVLVTIALGVVVLIAYFLFSGDKEPATQIAEATPAVAAAVDAEPTPEATPVPTPETTPAGPPSFAKRDNLHVLAFRVDGSLTASIRRSLPAEYQDMAGTLARRLADALRWQLDTRRDLRRDDEVKIVFNPTAKTERAPLYGFWYKSRRLGKELKFIYFPQAKGTLSAYFDSHGTSIAERMKRPPLTDEDLANASLENLSTKGIRYNVAPGTRVMMPFPARVLRLNWDQDNLGRSIEVRYLDSGNVAWFAHLETVGEKVKEGAIIGSGSFFAATGATGKTTRPCLLYRTFKAAEGAEPTPVSPLEVHKTEAQTLPAADRVAFVAVNAKIGQLFGLVTVPAASPPAKD